MLVGAGLAGGIITSMVGGASLVTFPAMLAAGLPPLMANASNTIAVFPGGAVAVLVEFKKMPRFDGRLKLLCLAGAVGGAAGAALLFFTPERLFVALVPALLGLATLIFAASPAIKRAIARQSAAGRGARSGPALLYGSVLLASIYGGYFGAGLGVILLAILAIAGFDDLRVANLVKNLISTLVSLAAVTVFVAKAMVVWPATLAMASGAIVGGVIGVWLVRILPPGIVRGIVTAIGASLTLTYAWRFWFA